ncbi:MAG: hypothetical protein ACOCV2_14915 [Persicimonas sp.]
MTPLIRRLYDFFLGGTQSAINNVGLNGTVDIVTVDKNALATHGNTTEGRYKGHSVGEFLEMRWNKMQNKSPGSARLGGVWLGRRALFDFSISVKADDGATRIESCNCGYYALVDASEELGTDSLEVALRYDADFVNVGRQWATHPTHHLEWERVEPENPLGVTETRTRVEPMLPTHFFEFCTRHFQPDVWQRVFEPHTDDLAKLTNDVNDATQEYDRDAARLEIVDAHRAHARSHTDHLREFCDLDCEYEWRRDEAIALPL